MNMEAGILQELRMPKIYEAAARVGSLRDPGLSWSGVHGGAFMLSRANLFSPMSLMSNISHLKTRIGARLVWLWCSDSLVSHSTQNVIGGGRTNMI